MRPFCPDFVLICDSDLAMWAILGYCKINDLFVFNSAFCRALSKRSLSAILNPNAIAMPPGPLFFPLRLHAC